MEIVNTQNWMEHNSSMTHSAAQCAPSNKFSHFWWFCFVIGHACISSFTHNPSLIQVQSISSFPVCFPVHTKSICIHNLIFLSISIPIMSHLVGFTIHPPTHPFIHPRGDIKPFIGWDRSWDRTLSPIALVTSPPSPFLHQSLRLCWRTVTGESNEKLSRILSRTRICNPTPWPPLSAPRLPPASCRHRSPPWAARPWSQAPLLVSCLYSFLCRVTILERWILRKILVEMWNGWYGGFWSQLHVVRMWM